MQVAKCFVGLQLNIAEMTSLRCDNELINVTCWLSPNVYCLFSAAVSACWLLYNYLPWGQWPDWRTVSTG